MIDEDEVIIQAMCESNSFIPEPSALYRFVVVQGCAACMALANIRDDQPTFEGPCSGNVHRLPPVSKGGTEREPSRVTRV